MSWRALGRQMLIGISLASLLASRALAGAPRPLMGQIEAANGAAVGGWPARSHEALFSGDVVTTPAESSVLLKLPAFTQASVFQRSSIRLQLDTAGYPLAELSSGAVLTTTAGRSALRVQTAKYRVRPAEEAQTIYLVGLLPDRTTIVAARQGDLLITALRSRKDFRLARGHYIVFASSASVVPGQQEEKEENKQAPGKAAGQAAPPPTSSPQAQPPSKPVKQPWHIGSLSHGTSIALIVAAAGGVAAVAAVAASGGGPPASPSEP